ncbi:MAG: efflux RND transporter periplasmic adaptor subunit [Rhodoferax sp.]|jgi:RND family efflux transporter MFP subunit|nr:efflux RND transporter periplasmic adaptor subunit [Rhodoferax sp.]
MTLKSSPPTLWSAVALTTLSLATVLALQARAADDKKPAAAASAPATGKAALTVTLTQARSASIPVRLAANGNIAAWQEASVGTEANGLRLAQVLVNVGEAVRRGQVLATFAPDTLQAEAAQTAASVAEAEATLAEARANAQRARDLQVSGALSAQQINQYLTAERTAQARLEAQQAMAKMQQLRLAQTRVLAPDDGIISARSATVGAVLPAGQELFRMIRQSRLEWRAEVPAADLGAIKAGQAVQVTPPNLPPVKGRVRMVAPTVDPQTRNGLVYVDLVQPGGAKAGMFARGEFELGTGSAMTLPQTAVLLRDGFSYVLRVGADSRVSETKVRVGRRSGDRIEILDGLPADARVVESGVGFLGDGDTVKVVNK